ncbi:type 2 isopentenyl-diphosphate Delta-isomerase [Carnimonas nigrificans]|uniref:type 2 isopentenyl-diphosphate Delta-isomerase n=1 Tax=Carnimonas nigrificans TaxID=64323 RepID=UPI000471FF70|nr:type 2 isopentenyl-diphosphate Delta-isomerase [Carnimonas nigrificans]
MSQSQRKDDHVAHAEALFKESRHNEFDDLEFVHHSLPGIDCDQVALETSVGSFEWSLPFYINGMTGGSQKTGEINRQLGEVASATGLAIATGSQSAALKNPELRDTFSTLRKHNPHGFVMGNVGVDTSPELAEQAVEMLDADALQVHINAPQELVMPEGDRHFSAWLDNLAAIRERVGVPVIAKEVGFGMSDTTIRLLQERGITLIDVSGRGGTDFIAIENLRRPVAELDYIKGWGQSAAASLIEAAPVVNSAQLLASGGVRTPLDVVKALALGAKAVGVSGQVLHTLMNQGPEALIAMLEEWKQQLRTLMTMIGAANVASLQHSDLLLRGRLREYCELRGLNPAGYARRSRS